MSVSIFDMKLNCSPVKACYILKWIVIVFSSTGKIMLITEVPTPILIQVLLKKKNYANNEGTNFIFLDLYLVTWENILERGRAVFSFFIIINFFWHGK